jgi:16S rRNA (cytosine967-C5)-methyltransferase
MADPTRNSAFDILTAVLEQHRPLEDALDALPATELRDRAAAHRIAAAVLRRAGSLDAVLEPFLRREPPAPVRHILRLGAAQLLLLDTPAHAAVATSVALTRARGLAPFAGLVNAVLRRVAEAGPAALAELDGPRLDTPPWLWASWGSNARAIATAHEVEAPIDLTIQTDAPPGGETLALNTVRYPAGTRIVDLPGFIEGAFWVQDFAATLPAHLLAAQPGERVADLCAAPGGKAAQLSATGAIVTAVEHNPHRIARLRENLDRLQMAPTIVQADATAWQPPEKFDAVLLDAPCSATGTIRRHPDVPHLKRARDLVALTAQQDAMLANAAAMLRPGGRLVYAVCSLQPEEGPQRLAAAAAAGLRHNPFTPEELAFLPEARTTEGCLRTYPSFWPDRGGMDGFFAARFVRA